MPSTSLPSSDPIWTGSSLHQLLVLIANRITESASPPDATSESRAITNHTNQPEGHNQDVGHETNLADVNS